ASQTQADRTDPRLRVSHEHCSPPIFINNNDASSRLWSGLAVSGSNLWLSESMASEVPTGRNTLTASIQKNYSSSVLSVPTQTRGQERRPARTPNQQDLLEQLKGVLQKNLKTFVYLGAVLLAITAALFSSSGKKTPILRDKTRRMGHLVVPAEGWVARARASRYCKKYPETLSPALVTIHRASLPASTITVSTLNDCPSDGTARVPEPWQLAPIVEVPLPGTVKFPNPPRSRVTVGTVVNVIPVAANLISPVAETLPEPVVAPSPVI